MAFKTSYKLFLLTLYIKTEKNLKLEISSPSITCRNHDLLTLYNRISAKTSKTLSLKRMQKYKNDLFVINTWLELYSN